MGVNGIHQDLQGLLNSCTHFDPTTGRAEIEIFHNSSHSSNNNPHIELNSVLDRAFVFFFNINALSTINI